MAEIIPSPGTDNTSWEEVEKKLEKAKSFAKTIHVDILDGIFSPEKTLSDPSYFKKYSDDFLLEVHLMTDNPIEYLESFSQSGFKRFIGHVEKMRSIPEFVAEGQTLGEVGLAIDKDTDMQILDPLNLDDLDLITIMTIKAGRSGQEFIPELLEKVREVRSRSDIEIEVDGGINLDTIQLALDAGATKFVATSFIWNSNNPQEAYNELKSKLS